MWRSLLWGLGALLAGQVCAAQSAEYRELPGGSFVSVLSVDGARAPIIVAPFSMRTTPVTQADYLAFVQLHPEWQRDNVPTLYVSGGYLRSWLKPLTLGKSINPQQAVTEISWFAARAYCASENARLPYWYEWEYAAAADASHPDARSNPMRNAQILQALLNSTGQPARLVGQKPSNYYGLHDMNTLVWEWVNDYAALFVNADARDPGQQNLLKLCGGSALAFEDRTAYSVMMRVAVLAAMDPSDVSGNIGFRCVRNNNKETAP